MTKIGSLATHLLLLLFCHSLSLCFSADTYDADKISYMPLYSGKDVNFNTYGGYLDGKTGSMYYLLTESASNDGNNDNDPLVLWLNGGPGCSSLLGAFTELGPYHVTDNGESIEYNPYSWNNLANMLFLEAPPCVGFSYPYTKNCTNFTTNDNNTAINNYYALQSFFSKFSKYQNREFYITGESYAGHYIPTLATYIIEQNEKLASESGNSNDNNNFININLTGIGIGNPYTQRDSNFFEGFLPQMYSMGIISNEERKYLISNNCSNQEMTGNCSNQINKFIDTHLNDINIYDVNVRSNCTSLSRQQSTLLRNVMNADGFETNLEELNIFGYPYSACDSSNLHKYLNTKSVYSTMNVNTDWIENYIDNLYGYKWNDCSYWNGYDSKDDSTDMSAYYPYILNNNVKVLIYSGNVDLVCAYLGTRYWVYNNLTESDKGNEITNGWESWHVMNENNEIVETGGWYQSWDKFTFLVVRDAGHEVPEYQPARAYTMFKRFLNYDFSDSGDKLNTENFIDYDDSDDDITEVNDLWIGVGIGICSMIAINASIYLYCYCKRKGKLDKFRGSVDMQDNGYQEMNNNNL